MVRLHGDWTQGDVAIYGWDSAGRARRPLMSFSSGQRGRGLLLPALPGGNEGRLFACFVFDGDPIEDSKPALTYVSNNTTDSALAEWYGDAATRVIRKLDCRRVVL